MLVLLMYHHPDLNPHDTWFEKGKSFSFDSLKVYNIHTVYIYHHCHVVTSNRHITFT